MNADDFAIASLHAARRNRIVGRIGDGAGDADWSPTVTANTATTAATATSNRLARTLAVRGLPREGGPHGVGVERRLRIAGEQLEQRGELRAAPDVAQRRPAVRRLSRPRTMTVDVPRRRSSRDRECSTSPMSWRAISIDAPPRDANRRKSVSAYVTPGVTSGRAAPEQRSQGSGDSHGRLRAA